MIKGKMKNNSWSKMGL